LSTDTTTNIGLGSPLRFETTQTPQGLGTQLNSAVNNLLGTFFFPQTGNMGSGTVDAINLLPGASALSSSLQSYLVGQLKDGGTIRLVAAPETSGVAATYAGIDNFAFPNGAPMLTAVPEQSSLILIGLGLAGTAIAARRRPSRTVSAPPRADRDSAGHTNEPRDPTRAAIHRPAPRLCLSRPSRLL
jgi:hypothetical protein